MVGRVLGSVKGRRNKREGEVGGRVGSEIRKWKGFIGLAEVKRVQRMTSE